MTDVLIAPHELDKIDEVNAIESKHPTADELQHIERRMAVLLAPKIEPNSATCNTKYKASKTSGKRPLTVIDLIVMHATQGGTARSNASYFSGASAGGSTQLVVDDYTCYRCLGDDDIPWGAPGANYNGFHIEQAAYSSWTSSLWNKTHRKMLMRAAYKAAFHCKKYGIKVRWLSHAQLKTGMRNGITTHWECTQAFGGDHTDPGNGWPRVLFMTMVRGYYATIKVKKAG